jgi:MoaA/NifB/PqqE/SkfB family radical SAM enzyme
MNTMTTNRNYTGLLNKSLKIFFNSAVRISLKRPGQAYYFLKTVGWQKKAAALRTEMEGQGTHVPPIIIYSITEHCNLRCKGCYAHSLHDQLAPEMSTAKMRQTIQEAHDLGVGFMVLAGGEPLVRREILNIIGEFKDMIFFVFTNGTMINDLMADRIRRLRNVVPIISLEGDCAQTDARRGQGVYKSLETVIGKLKKRGIFFGTSITVTQNNFSTVTDGELVKNLNKNGCKLFFFVEYTPVDDTTTAWEITDAQRAIMTRRVAQFRKETSALFINLPDDEKDFGGCLSSGRGFVHISAQGDIEPCPFAPYSDTSLRNATLKEALQSDFLAAVRENSSQLHEGSGGCALWREREWLTGLLADHKRRKLIAEDSGAVTPTRDVPVKEEVMVAGR